MIPLKEFGLNDPFGAIVNGFLSGRFHTGQQSLDQEPWEEVLLNMVFTIRLGSCILNRNKDTVAYVYFGVYKDTIGGVSGQINGYEGQEVIILEVYTQAHSETRRSVHRRKDCPQDYNTLYAMIREDFVRIDKYKEIPYVE